MSPSVASPLHQTSWKIGKEIDNTKKTLCFVRQCKLIMAISFYIREHLILYLKGKIWQDIKQLFSILLENGLHCLKSESGLKKNTF